MEPEVWEAISVAALPMLGPMFTLLHEVATLRPSNRMAFT
jgi:hypothetical protein